MLRFLIIVSLLSLLACNKDKEEVKQSIPMKTVDSVAVESFGVRFYLSDSAKVTAELYASHVIEVKSTLELKEEEKNPFKKHLSRSVDHVMSVDKGAHNVTAIIMQEAVSSFPREKKKEEDKEEKKNKASTSPAIMQKGTTYQYMEDSIHIDFLDRSGRAHSFIESESGIYNQEENWALLIEDVVIKNQKGERLETDQLFWDKTIDSVFTHKPVKITTPDKIITGSKGMRSNTAFSSYVIFGTYGEVSLDAVEEDKSAPPPPAKPRTIQKPRLIK